MANVNCIGYSNNVKKDGQSATKFLKLLFEKKAQRLDGNGLIFI